jgi:regulator of cell morphogenesis and NO signaling
MPSPARIGTFVPREAFRTVRSLVGMTDVQDRSLGDIVAANPSAARVFERHGIDYCCGGGRSLVEACADRGVDASVVGRELDALPTDDPPAWAGLEPSALADHIVATHHAYLHQELPLLDALAGKVAAVHGRRHPELAEVARLVTLLRADLEPHLRTEEGVLFPAIRAGVVALDLGDVLDEHGRAGELLAGLRAATAGYAVPADGCASYASLYERLRALEADTHEHVHKENNVLFPAVRGRVVP